MEQIATVDVFTAEIIRNGLTACAFEMGKTLARTAHSTLLYDVQDFGVGVVGADGSVWGETPGITIFTGCLPEVIKSSLRKYGPDGFQDGDVLVANDPYDTGTHVSDTSVYMPVFHCDELVAFTISTAHWADVGAKAPGGWCPDSTDVYQEGVCFSHQKLVVAGQRNRDIWDVIASNVRLPETVIGDLEAQIASCRLGVTRVQALCVKYGVSKVRSAMAATIERTEAAMRRLIADLPDGTYTASIDLDWDGVVRGNRPRVKISLTISGDRIRASFAGSSLAARGPINLPWPGTRGAVRVCLKSLLMPLDKTNDGHFRIIEFEDTPGLLVSPERPAPCDSYGYVNAAVGRMVLQAMSEVVPGRAPAGDLQLLALFLFRVDPRDGSRFMFIEPVHGGQGGSMKADGPTLARFADGDAANTPSEVIELRYPIRCERFAFRPEAIGAGKFRGGPGIRRDYRALETGILMQTANENTIDVLARGMRGGQPGKPSEVVMWPETPRELLLVERVSGFGPLSPGDVISVRTGGGGGWGDPRERNPDLVLADVRDEIIDGAVAETIYGVAITTDSKGLLTVDIPRTQRLRRTCDDNSRAQLAGLTTK
jgi:N-methylhydantoinase B